MLWSTLSTLCSVTLVIPFDGWREILRFVTHAPLPLPGYNPTSAATFSAQGLWETGWACCPMLYRSSSLIESPGIKQLISIGFFIHDRTSWTSWSCSPTEANCESNTTRNVNSPPLAMGHMYICSLECRKGIVVFFSKVFWGPWMLCSQALYIV